jgi:hypothetical protein
MKINPHRIMILEVWACFLLASFCANAGALEDLPWGPPSNGIQVSLILINPKLNDLQIAFRNIGNRDVVLNLGSMLANGKVQIPDKIVLNLTDAQGKNRVLKYFDARGSGRVDDYIVPLRVDSIYTLKIKSDQVIGPNPSQSLDIALLPGKNSLKAQFQGTNAQFVNLDTEGIRLMNFWLGLAESNILIIER